jgi:hypothetical protein
MRNRFSLIILIFGIIFIISFVHSACVTTTEATLSNLEISTNVKKARSGEEIQIKVRALDEQGNPLKDFKDEVVLETTNDKVFIDEPYTVVDNFVNGVSNTNVKLVNTSINNEVTQLIASHGETQALTETEITIISPFYETGRVIFPYEPENKNIKLLTKIERSIRLGEQKISNPLLLGKDKNNNFLVYIKKPTNLILKITNDGALSAVITESEDINSAPGEVLSGVVDKENNKLYILKNDNGKLILMFLDVSGNIIKEYKQIGNTTDIVRNHLTQDIDDAYTFEPIGLEIINKQAVVVVREVREGASKLAQNRPTFIVLNTEGEVENVILITPPLITAFGSDYWTKTTVNKLDFKTAIDKNYIYVLWGSGYSTQTKVGYMVQKFSLSGKEEASFTRLIKDTTPPLDDESLETGAYDPQLEDTYVARGIYADNDRVYVRIKLDDKDFVDIYNKEEVYYERYNVEVDVGETSLVGSRNMVKLEDRLVLASDSGIYIFKVD